MRCIVVAGCRIPLVRKKYCAPDLIFLKKYIKSVFHVGGWGGIRQIGIIKENYQFITIINQLQKPPVTQCVGFLHILEHLK